VIALNNQTRGQILNMISNDCSRIESSIFMLPYLIIGPIQAIIIVIVMVNVVDITFVCGVWVILLTIVIQSALARIFSKMRFIKF
jgi:ATP-binding cassette subfamily C (CFTR/MRP) protein 4